MVYERVKEYCERNEITISKFEEICEIGNGIVGKWKNREPMLNTVIRISEKTGIPVEKWIK